MTNTRVTQGHKVLISAGGEAPARVTQGHVIMIAGGGEAPAIVTQTHKIVIFSIDKQPPEEPSLPNFMAFVP